MLEEFFSRWPGTDVGRPGLGRALLDFQAWEIDSGRLADDDGSPWWSAVNGWLVLDLDAARRGVPGPWFDYTLAEPADQQDALWVAHQQSIEAGVRAAAPLLRAEPPEERSFTRLALAVVEAAAALGYPTSGDGLGRQTRATYPSAYPSTAAALAQARAAVEVMGLSTET